MASASINIPKRRRQRGQSGESSAASSLCETSEGERAVRSAEGARGGQKAERRVSLLSPSLLAQEHTIINVGHPDGPPRLITCVRSSQGFDWNQDIFLPSHSDHLSLSPDLERKKDPVHEIVLTDDDMREMFPQ